MSRGQQVPVGRGHVLRRAWWQLQSARVRWRRPSGALKVGRWQIQATYALWHKDEGARTTHARTHPCGCGQVGRVDPGCRPPAVALWLRGEHWRRVLRVSSPSSPHPSW